MNLRAAILKNVGVSLLAAGAGFLGSVIHDRGVIHFWTRDSHEVFRAQRFEVVDHSGALLSYWGPDSNPQIPVSTPRGVILVFIDPKGVRRCEIGSRVGDFGPELKFYDESGPSEVEPRQSVPEPRFAVSLFYGDDPILAMRGRDAWRVLLGAEHGDAPSPSEDTWSLRIRGGDESYALLTGYKTYFGQYGAGVLLRDNAQSWSLPTDLIKRWNKPSRSPAH
jgi:hypothetical protein